ncbi:alginate regulatory protein AlgP [Myxococcus hansupus]|uniref:Alginate regulatory protein AlgP n=1 Tax=Pseudomyxococcus hansupus TaxID=1297742 RepID=A0A0H4X0J6_9BACT|nr:DUF4912 domain-containing protein [Myxococcus hansupus]AKQ67105.1 alginate regulatory protein AlgP [Myxococcus hansupus]
MEDLKSVTVGYLRELARKHLGTGYSRMRKEELLAALAAYVPALAKLARLAGIRVPGKLAAPKAASKAPDSKAPHAAPATQTARSSKAASGVEAKEAPAPGQGRVSAPKRVAAKRASEKPGSKPPARPATVVNFPPKPRVERPREPVTPVVSSYTRPVEPKPKEEAAPVASPKPVQHAAEPVVEGFFVARVAGEDEARHHHLVEPAPATAQAPVEEESEGLGALPAGYQDDTVLLLPRDPHTLFVSWDFSLGARLRAEDGLDAPRPVLRVFDGEHVIREEAFVLEAPGFYVQGLAPGGTYRVEAHFIGRDGRSRRIGASSNRVTLPPMGVSTDLTVRFLRVPPVVEAPPSVPAARALPDEEREYISWRRVNLPGSGGAFDVPEVHRERSGGARDDAHLEGVERAPGASDQRYVGASERAHGASDQRYAAAEARALGASDMRYLADAAPRTERVAQGAVTSPVPRYLETLSRAPGASDQRYVESTERSAAGVPPSASRAYLDVRGVPGASDLRYAEGAPRPGAGAVVPRAHEGAPVRLPHRYLDVRGIPGASDLRYQDGATGQFAAERSPQGYLDVRGMPGASDLRHQAQGSVSGQAVSTGAPHRYLDVRGMPGASDLRYQASAAQPQLGHGPGASGASDQRYLDHPSSVAGSPYLGHVPRASGASDQRYEDHPYLGHVPRASGASDQGYLATSPGASDLRYLETPERASGASEQHYQEAPGRTPEAATWSSQSTPRAAGAVGSQPVDDAAGDRERDATEPRFAETHPRRSEAPSPAHDAPAPSEEENHRYFEVPPPSRKRVTSRPEDTRSGASDDSENHRYFEVPASSARVSRPQHTEAGSSTEVSEPLPGKPPTGGRRS